MGRPLFLYDIVKPIPYKKALALQKIFLKQRQSYLIDDLLILLEHSPAVFTVGRQNQEKNILTDLSVPVVEISRGGEISYHGPGQIVGYIIAELSVTNYSVRQFIDRIEEFLIYFLWKNFFIQGRKDKRHRGVWIGREKIAAIGIEIHKRVTMHGFALNVNNDLKIFEEVIPCGILGRGVTSLKKQTGVQNFDFLELKERLAESYRQIFGYQRIIPYGQDK